MSTTPGHVFRQILMDAEVCILPGLRVIRDDLYVHCFVDFAPDEVNNCVIVKNMASALYGHNQRSGHLFEHPQVLISIRHEDKDEGQTVAEAAYDAVQSFSPATAVAGEYEGARGAEVSFSRATQSVYATTSLLSLGEEVGKKRYLWSFTSRVAFQAIN